MKLVAVSISSKEENWQIRDIPFYCYTGEWEPFTRFRIKQGIQTLNISKERIDYLARRRNRAVELALHQNPEANDIMMIDSYYIRQLAQIRRLIADYEHCNAPLILGATTWFVDRTRIIPKTRFYDSWTSIEARFIHVDYLPVQDPLVGQYATPMPNLMPVRSVGACYIFPREIWDKGVRYGVLNDLHGCEHNYLCESARLSVYLDFNVRLWREPLSYPLGKRLRVSLAAKRRLSNVGGNIKTWFTNGGKS